MKPNVIPPSSRANYKLKQQGVLFNSIPGTTVVTTFNVERLKGDVVGIKFSAMSPATQLDLSDITLSVQVNSFNQIEDVPMLISQLDNSLYNVIFPLDAVEGSEINLITNSNGVGGFQFKAELIYQN